MKRTLLLWSVFAFVLSASAQYYYSYNNPVRLYLTDTVVVDSGNPDIENYLAIDPSLAISRNDKYTIISDKKILPRNDLKTYSVYKTEEGCLLGCSGQILFFPNNEEDIDFILQSFPLELLRKTPSYVLAKVSENTTDDDLSIANAIQESGLVQFSHPNFIANFQKHQDPINDPYFPYQFYLHCIGQVINDGHLTTIDADINAPEAWELTKGNASIIIAVIDGGVTSDHPDLPNDRQIRLSGSNFAWQYDNTSIDDPSPRGNDNHGNACAGIIAATHNNEGISGVAPNCIIMPIRVPFDYGTIDVFDDAILFAVSNGADIISNSWGTGSSVPDLFPAIVNAINNATANGRNGKGCVVTFSAGNTANRVVNNNGYVTFPANCANVSMITVGASDRYNQVANYSPNGDKISVVAPSHKAYPNQISGENFEVWSIDIPGLSGYNPDENTNETLPSSGTNYLSYTGRFGGTSAACPQISGVSALILSVNPNLSSLEVKDIIEQTTKKIGITPYINNHINGTWNQEMGYGLVDAHKAVVYAMEYGHGYIIGPENLSGCGIGTYSCDFSHPDIFTYTWTTTSNLSITSNNGSSITVMPSSTGTGTLTVEVRQQGRLMYTLTKTINVSSVWTGITPIATAPFHITSSTTWSSETFLPVTAIVDQDATLTVTDDVLCGTYARIVVRPGGKLVVDGGTLTSACTGEMWQGICVEGHSNLHQTAANQGKVVLRNGAAIENALCGIRTGAPGDTSTTSTGGIITAEDATFRNCNMAVYMRPYTDYTATGLLKPNASSFYRCTFSVDNAYYGLPGSEVMARLWGVAGVRFGGCTFSLATTPMNTGRSYGIYSEDAGFTVDTYCSQEIMNSDCSCPSQYATLSSFSGFYKAVNVNTSGSPFAVTIDEVSFSNNQTGVFVSGNNHTTVTRCQFDLSTAPETAYPAIGLELTACTGFLVEGNAFSRSTSSFPTYGIKAVGLGISNNSLYRNTFSGLTYGIYSSGNNGGSFSGLRFSCNTFSQNTHDIYVTSGQVAETQGSASAGADNSFSSGATGNFEVVNPKCWLDYYYSTGGSHSPTVHTSNVLLHPNALANGCASTLCTGGGVIKGLTEYRALSNSIDGVSADNYDADGRTDRIAVLQEMSDITSENIRGIEGGDTIDVDILKDWFSAISETWSKYSLAETEYFSDEDNTPTLLGIPALLTTTEERDEYDNYMAFNALKEALSGHLHGHANWPMATEAQITELQRIADAGTGRSSVMARGVLCFFFGICYDDDDFSPTGDIRRLASTGEAGNPSHNSDVSMKLYPNPATNTLHVEFEGTDDLQGTLTVTDITGVVVLTRECHNPVTQLDVSNLSPGLYVVSFRNEKGVVVRKFVKM